LHRAPPRGGHQEARALSSELAVRLQPRAKRTEVVGEREGKVVVRVTAPPVDGRANDALCKLIAQRAGVPRSRVAIVRGAGSRDKLVRVDGMSPDAVRRALSVPARS
jgi:uncharacterized protein (TIGR00251 family)